MRVMLPYWTNSGNRSWTVTVDSKTFICNVSITTHDIDWENTSVLDYDNDFYRRKVKEALLIKQKANFNQDSGLAVSPIWSSVLQSH